MRRQPEKAEQRAIIQALSAARAKVYVLGHPSPNDGRTHRGTMQTPGLPDVLAFLPMRDERAWIALAIEVKAPKGRLSDAQEEFSAYWTASGNSHLVGGVDVVLTWLVRYGYIKADAVAHYRRPRVEARP